MKGTLITIIVLLGLGALAYFFYGSLQDLGNEQTNYDFAPAEEIQDDSSEEELSGEFQSEIELETEIEAQESEEAQADAEFDELEAMDFNS